MYYVFGFWIWWGGGFSRTVSRANEHMGLCQCIISSPIRNQMTLVTLLDPIAISRHAATIMLVWIVLLFSHDAQSSLLQWLHNVEKQTWHIIIKSSNSEILTHKAVWYHKWSTNCLNLTPKTTPITPLPYIELLRVMAITLSSFQIHLIG